MAEANKIAPAVPAENVHRLATDAKARPEARVSEAPAAVAPPAPGQAKRSRRSLRRPLMFALLPIALVAGAYFYVTGGATMSTDDAYVQADMVGLSTDVSGIVRQVMVHDNQKVAKGDVLFKLDDQQFRLALDRTNAQLGTARNDLIALQASYRNMQAQIEQAKTDIEYSDTNFKRQQALISNNFTPQASVDTTRNNLSAARQKLASLTQQLAAIAANLNGNPDAAVEDHPRYKEALAARNEAQRQLDHTVVYAPFSGIVTNVPSLQPGQYLAAAATGFNIVSTDHVWVQANPKETELTYVRPGQKASIEIDSYPGEPLTGIVESVAPASASAFSLLPAENSSGNWVKVVQRIPLRVRVDNIEGRPPLRVGMSVELNIETGHKRGLPDFLTKMFRSSPAAATATTGTTAATTVGATNG